MKTKIAILFLTAVSIVADPGFFIEDNWKPRVTPQFQTVRDTTVSYDTSIPNSVIITPTDTIHKIASTFFGNNANGYMGPQMVTADNALKHLRNANISFMRLPGGNWSNTWLWDHNRPANLDDAYYATTTSAPNKNWTLTTDTMYALADSIDAIIQPCVNYSISRYFIGSDSVERAAGYAASWVRDVTSRGINAPYWEIGNENYGSWQSGYVVNRDTITGYQYGRDAVIFIDSMKSANPDIKVGVVIYPDSSSDKKGWYSWTKGVLSEAENSIDYLILHEYFTWANNMNDVTSEEVIASISKIKSDKEIIEAMVGSYTSKPAGSFPIMVSEYNLRAGYKEMSILTPIFQTMAVNEFIKNGYGIVNVWDMSNGYSPPSSDKGDHGFLTRKNPNLQDYEPNTAFFGYYYMTQFMGDALINTEATDTTVRWYSSTFSDGTIGVIAVNSNGVSAPVKVSINGYSIDSITWFTLDADSIESENIRINGVVPEPNWYGAQMYDTISPYHAVVTDEGLTLTIPPISLLYATLSVTKDSTTAIGSKVLATPQTITISQRGKTLHFENKHGFKRVSLHLLNGRELYSKNITHSYGVVSINTSSLSKGSYIVRLQGLTTVTQKIIVQ